MDLYILDTLISFEQNFVLVHREIEKILCECVQLIAHMVLSLTQGVVSGLSRENILKPRKPDPRLTAVKPLEYQDEYRPLEQNLENTFLRCSRGHLF